MLYGLDLCVGLMIELPLLGVVISFNPRGNEQYEKMGENMDTLKFSTIFNELIDNFQSILMTNLLIGGLDIALNSLMNLI